MDDSPGETSLTTWGFEKAKVKVSIKGIPSHKSHRSECPKVLINEAMICLVRCICPEQSNKKTISFASTI